MWWQSSAASRGKCGSGTLKSLDLEAEISVRNFMYRAICIRRAKFLKLNFYARELHIIGGIDTVQEGGWMNDKNALTCYECAVKTDGQIDMILGQIA
jgi:hypothetical protein